MRGVPCEEVRGCASLEAERRGLGAGSEKASVGEEEQIGGPLEVGTPRLFTKKRPTPALGLENQFAPETGIFASV